MSSFLALITILLEFVCRTESVQERNLWFGQKNSVFYPFYDQINDAFVALSAMNKLQ